MFPASLDGIAEAGQRLGECRDDHPFAVLGPNPWAMAGW